MIRVSNDQIYKKNQKYRSIVCINVLRDPKK